MALEKCDLTHRDIKPQNILIDKFDIELCDFGVSKILEEKTMNIMLKNFAQNTYHYDATAAGTPSYMCPEIIEGLREHKI